MTKNSSKEVINDLRKSLAWLDLALATLNEGVIVLDGDMKILFANDAIATMVGKPRVLLLGASVWDEVNLYDEGKALSANDFKAAQQKASLKSLSGVYQLWSDSRIVNIELTGAHITNTRHTVLVIRDVTERLQAQAQRLKTAQEQAARKAAEVSEQRMHVQYKVASLLAESRDQNSTLIQILSTVCKSLGWKAGIVWVPDGEPTTLRVATSWTDASDGLSSFVVESQKIVFLKGEGLPGQVWEKAEPQWSSDVLKSKNFPRKNIAGKSGLHGAFAVPLQSGKDFIGVMEFFSEHEQEQDTDLLTSIATVGMQIAEYMRRTSIEKVTDSLREQKARLLELNDAKNEFISLASHQLRTPATGVKQFLGMLIDGYGGELTGDQKKLADAAYDSNERQLTIVNDLLKVAQVDAGKVVIKKEKVNLKILMLDIIEEQRAKFSERRQQVTFTNSASTLFAAVDERHFRMAMENIIDNSSKYTEPGKNITVTLSKAKNVAVISIIDEGVGIAADDIDKIFAKFTRLDNSLSLSVGGSGIGLYWSKKVVELHDGTISVTSKAGEGTTFTITIPLK